MLSKAYGRIIIIQWLILKNVNEGSGQRSSGLGKS